MRKYFTLFIIFFVLLLTAACTSEKTEKPEETQQVDDQEQQEGNDETSNEDESSEDNSQTNDSSRDKEGLFAQSIEEIYFLQQDKNERSQRGIYEFTGETLPTEQTTLALHDESVYVFLTFTTTNQDTLDELLNQINIQGAKDQNIEETKSSSPNQTTRYKIKLFNTEDQVTFQFGDIPAITLEKKKPLTMTIEPDRDNRESLLFKNEEYPYSLNFPRYYYGNGVIKHIIHFSEPMRTDIDVSRYMKGKHVIADGEWIDNQTYELRIEKASGRIRLEASERNEVGGRILSQTGNYLPYETITFESVKKQEWKDLSTGERVGWSSKDFLYDFLLFSPDRSAYIGVTEIVREGGDAQGSYYGFTLEQKGSHSKQIVQSHYTGVMRKGLPLEWIDHNHIMYADDEHVYKMNVETGERETLLAKEQHNGSINQYAYNPSNGNVYVLVEHFNKTFEDSTVDRWIYNQKNGQWKQEKNYSELVQNGIYWANSLSIHMANEGVLFSKAEDGQIYTVYDQKNSSNKKVLGEVILKTEQGVYLETRTGEYNNDLNQLYFWNLEGEKPKQIQNPPDLSYRVHPFGPNLLAVNGTPHTLVYNKQSGEWESYANQPSRFQEVAPLFKVQR